MEFPMTCPVNVFVLNKFRFVAALTATISVLFGVVNTAEAGDIGGISPQIFRCMRNNPNSDGGGGITYHGDQNGNITINPVGLIQPGGVDFNYDQNSQTIGLSNAGGIAGYRIEGGLKETAEKCQRGELS